MEIHGSQASNWVGSIHSAAKNFAGAIGKAAEKADIASGTALGHLADSLGKAESAGRSAVNYSNELIGHSMQSLKSLPTLAKFHKYKQTVTDTKQTLSNTTLSARYAKYENMAEQVLEEKKQGKKEVNLTINGESKNIPIDEALDLYRTELGEMKTDIVQTETFKIMENAQNKLNNSLVYRTFSKLGL